MWMIRCFVFMAGVNMICVAGELFHESLTEQEKVDYFGVEARYNVPEYVVVNPLHVSKHKQFPVYKINALGEDYLLHLSPNHRLTSQGCTVHHRRHNSTGHGYPCKSKGDNCHYHGASINHNSSIAAISNCNGLEGVVTTKDHDLILKPIRKEHQSRMRRDTANANPHLAFKKPSAKLKEHTCGVHGTNKYLSKKKSSRRKRQVPTQFHLEMALVADKEMFLYHGQNLRQYMLTIANIAAARFMEPSLRREIIFTVVKLEIQEDDVPGLEITEEADDTLTRFCDWQEDFNEPDDNSPHHYDGISLLTRLDITHQGIRSNTGLGTVGGMCVPNARCTYCEDTGLDLGLTLAHETGHTLGMVHDGNDNYCEDGKYIMSGSGGGGPPSFMWSPCSAGALEDFLGDENSYCMDDFPSGETVKLPTELPGLTYSADEQCRLFMGEGSTICIGTSLVEQFNNDECARLVCYDPHNSGQCIGSQSPRMDGSECGDRKWCIKGICVEIGTKGPQPVNGGWSEYDADWSECSRSCGGGVKTKTRKCDNPSPRFGGYDCEGDSLKAELCNEKDCETSEYGFKEEQCAATDNEQLFGKTYHWIPYDIIGEEECFRYCQTVGEDGQIQLRTINNNENYTDGTTCSGDFQTAAFTKCVQGRCRAFSCDGKSDVEKMFDACGICGGKGDTCIQHSGTFNKGEKQRYIDFVRIPAGSTGVYIINQQSAFTSMRIKAGDDILFNKDGGRNDISGLYSGHGVKVKYMRQQRQPEVIEINGPIPVDIDAQVWKNFVSDFRNTQPDIYYEYYTPVQNKTKETTYKWRSRNQGCSVSCGRGHMKSIVECVDDSTDQVVGDDKCPLNSKPQTNVTVCNQESCPASWRVGSYGACSVSCDGGIRKRTVDCVQTTDDEVTIVGADNCASEKPDEEEKCGVLRCPGVWMSSQWSQCSQTCGYGMKTRDVTCVKNDTDHSPVTDVQCDFFNKPAHTEKCILAPCFTNITGDDCTDQADCTSKENICLDYPVYAKTNCLLHCGYCVKSSTIKEKQSCEDSAVCKDHSQDVCKNYQKWSQLNCPRMCGHCTDHTCEDKVDCKPYGKTVCTNYAEWSQINCRRFCNVCSNNASDLVSKQQINSTSSSSVKDQSTLVSNCSDSSDKCMNYDKSVCKDYQEWASINCRKYCDFCTDAVSESKGTTSKDVKNVCEDKLNCEAYGKSVCKDYEQWSSINCRKFCNICIIDSKSKSSLVQTQKKAEINRMYAQI